MIYFKRLVTTIQEAILETYKLNSKFSGLEVGILNIFVTELVLIFVVKKLLYLYDKEKKSIKKNKFT